MRSRLHALPILAAFVVLLAQAPGASAQYMYLDSNGDGIHTTADQVSPAGVTTIDIWLDTSENRDGSRAECPNDGTRYNYFSYVFSLGVFDGTASWGPFTNLQTGMPVHFGRRESATEYVDGYGGIDERPPGLYRLGSIVMTTLSGSPRVEIVPSTSISNERTSFGSTCPGMNFDNTIRLAVEWSDVDGLPFGSGGGPNQPPTLGPTAPITVSEGASTARPVTATDADGQPLTFSKTSGPEFFHVSTLNAEAGLGELFAFPRNGDAGQHDATVQVTDGIAPVTRSVSITVPEGAGHAPVLAPVPGVLAVTQHVTLVDLTASDPDGDAVTFALESGPPYASVETLRSAPGAARGRLRLAPGFCDVGESVARITASDGRLGHGADVAIRVVPLAPAPEEPVRRAESSKFPVGVVLADLDRDGHLDAVTSSFDKGVAILTGTGDGTLDPKTDLPTILGGSWPATIASGDLNEDSYPDVVVAGFTEPIVTVLLSRNGSLDRGTPIGTPVGPAGVSIADLNMDGHLDLIVSNVGSNSISVFLGSGDGTFGAMRETSVGDSPVGSAVADLNLDGIPDVAVAQLRSQTVSILLGIGNGFFHPRSDIALGGSPVAVAAADLNEDGAPDLAVANYLGASVQILAGNGDGTFDTAVSLPGPPSARPQLMAVGDLNLDGRPDLAVADVGRGYVLHNQGGLAFSDPVILVSALGIALGDLNEDGFLDIALVNEAFDGEVWSMLSTEGGQGSVAARAFPARSSPIGLGPNGQDVCVRLEPIHGSYESSELDLASITLQSEGTGSVESIQSVPAKRAVQDDADRNGVPDVAVCFAREDFAQLFDAVRGKAVVVARLQGSLLDGRPFCSSITLNVMGGNSGTLAATVSPNPLNPRATLRFTTSRSGAVKVRMYDLHGRVVRTLLERSILPAGSHDMEIDGRGRNGQTLASGIYFYEVEAAEGTVRGRMTVLK